MTSVVRIGLTLLALMTGNGIALAGDGLAVTKVWVRATIGQTGSTALYFTVTNGGSSGDALLAVEVVEAARTELHQTVNDNGVVGMRSIGELPVPPGAALVFEPRGNHVMLMGLKEPLQPGGHLRATLHFKSHPPVVIDAVVAMTPPLN